MNVLICPTVCLLDREISKELNRITNSELWPPERVANYRGVLHSKSLEVITEEDSVESAIQKILKFKLNRDFYNLLQQEKIKEALQYFLRNRKEGKTFIEALEQAHAVYNPSTLNLRVQYVSRMFSKYVTKIHNALRSVDLTTEYDRRQVCEGVKIGEKIYGGLSLIFDFIYKTILQDLIKIKQNIKNLKDGNSDNSAQLLLLLHQEREMEKILENWAVIQTFARASLRTTEKLNLGNTVEIVEESLEYNENYNIEDYNAEEAARESWHNEKDKQSAFGSLSAEVRRVLSMLPEYISEDKIKTDDLGLTIYLDPIEAHQKLSTMLLGCFTKDLIKFRLNKNKQAHPWVTPIIQLLDSDLEFATLFVINMHKGNLLYSGMYSKFKSGVRQFITKTLNRVENTTYSNYLADVFLGKKNDVFGNELSRKKIVDIVNKNAGSSVLSDRISLVTEYYSTFGFNISFEDAYEIASGRQWTVFHKLISKDYSQALKHYNNSTAETYYDKITAIKKGSEDNPLSEFLKKLTQILDTGKLASYERRITFKDSKGKTASYDSIVESSFMTDIFDTIHYYVESNNPEGLKLWIKNKFLICQTFYNGDLNSINSDQILNPWIKEMYLDADKGFAENGFCSEFNFDRFLGDIGSNIEFENFTSKQHIVANIQLYKKDKDISRGNSLYGHYPAFILGDSGIAKFIVGKRHDYNTTEGKQQIQELFYNIYLSEMNRKNMFESMLKKCKDDKINTKFSFISDDYKFEFKFLRFLNGNTDTNTLLSKKEFYEKLDDYMDSSIKEFKIKLKNYDCLNITDINGTKWYNDLGIKEENFDDFIEDFFWNLKISMISLLQFFTVDLAFYQDTKDLQKRYKEIHASGIPLNLDILEREEDTFETCIYFEDISVGREGYSDMDTALAYNFGLEVLGKNYNNFSREEIIQKGKETLKYAKYKSNTLTDGLGLRSLDSYRKVSIMAGTWTRLHLKAYERIKKIQNKEKITKEDIAEIAKLSVVFLPIKPFTYTQELFRVNETENKYLLIPVQHKYSEIVLIPELLPEGMLKDMAIFMQKNKIDVLASTKAVKVGCFGLTDIQYETDENFNHIKDSNGNKQEIKSKESLEKALKKGYIHKISYKNYRIQTNVPIHLNEDGLFGTQIRKLVMSQLNLDKTYEYFKDEKIKLYEKNDGEIATGRNILALYNALIISNILESFDEFAKTVKNGSKLSEIFILNVVSNGREALDNIFAYSITEDDKFVIPLFEGCLDHDSSATMFSMFKKAVNKQRIKGGSAVQASALGISGYEKDGGLIYVTDPNDPDNILYAECEIPFNLSYTDVNGKEIYLNFEDYCNADGTLILDTSKELIDPEEYKMYQSYYIIDENGNKHYYKPKIEVEYPDILSVIAYRIPTERAYSMINIRVKRFSPLISGGIIRVPAQGTTIAGFDFDIRLYWCH